MSDFEHGKSVGKSLGYSKGYQDGYGKGRNDVIAELESMGISVPAVIKLADNKSHQGTVVVTSYEDEVDSGYEAI